MVAPQQDHSSRTGPKFSIEPLSLTFTSCRYSCWGAPQHFLSIPCQILIQSSPHRIASSAMFHILNTLNAVDGCHSIRRNSSHQILLRFVLHFVNPKSRRTMYTSFNHPIFIRPKIRRAVIPMVAPLDLLRMGSLAYTSFHSITAKCPKQWRHISILWPYV